MLKQEDLRELNRGRNRVSLQVEPVETVEAFGTVERSSDFISVVTHFVIVVCPKVNRNKSQPNDAGGVHGEPDVLGLVEVFGNFASFESVQSAEDDEDHVVDKGHHQGEGGHCAGRDRR